MNNKVKELKNTLQELKDKITKQKNSIEFKNYLDTMAQFYSYSLYNCLLIAAQCPEASRVASYRTWQKMNRFVKKGEHGIHILVPCKAKKEENEKELDRVVMYFRSVCVFDIKQTEGEELPKWDISTPDQKIELMENLIQAVQNDNIKIEYVEDLKAYGTSSGGKIQLRKNENPATTFTTLIHEYAHEKLHQGQEQLKLSIEEREVEAETVSYVVCKHLNIKSTADKYLATWLKRDDLFKHLERIRSVSAKIIEKIEEIK